MDRSRKSRQHYQRTMNLMMDNNITEAISELKLSLKFNPRHTASLNMLGFCYYLKCRFDRAEEIWEKSLSIKQNYNEAEEYLNLLKNEKFSKMRKKYKEMLFSDDNKTGRKIKFLKKVIKEYGDLIEPYIILGLTYMQKKRFKKALQYFNQAYEKDKGSANIQKYIIEAENKLSQRKKIPPRVLIPAAAVIMVLILGFTFNSLLGNFGRPLPAGEESQQMAEVKNMSGESTDLAAENVKKTADRRVNTADNNDNDVDLNQVSRQNKKKYDLMDIKFAEDIFAGIDFRKFINNRDNKLRPNQYKISVENQQGKSPSKNVGSEIEERNTDKNNDSTVIGELSDQQLFNLAVDVFEKGNYSRSLPLFEKLYTEGKRNYLIREALFFLARNYERLGAYKKAKNYYYSYINTYQKSNYYDEALYNLGLLLYENNQVEESRQIMKKIVEEVPDSLYNNSRVKAILENN
ncbi:MULTISPECIES: tol-pal system YbgF family protein [unclassified Halanaerobium]|uniref:tetratricopeptide repeat protein n=1 Tax=unclassified Halanaerobium TaxID=2641197 RepID=UPI000DF18540|nr:MULTISPECIES: tetratricopeptide repeat protein [unclassified Halanaerobium]RCW47714.1 TolA-binding protein [Halanaerobium sp. MA284_MarDTE_T2]RCW84642.1 TolA-binding protein [Halanaerobium sp. DL-01]